MNKKIFSLAIFAFLLGLFAEKTNAQASGVKPELFMYRHNGSLGGSPLPAITGNTLGTIQWRGLTAIGSVLHGATIKSVATNVSPGVLNANMLFATNGPGGLTDHMILTPEGRVGIGTLMPSIVPHDFRLHVVGNTHTTGRFHGRIHYDEVAVPPTNNPSTYNDEAYFEQKTRSALDAGPGSLPVNALFPVGGILSLAPGGGSLDRQIFSGGNDGIWTRSQVGANSWDTWYKFLTGEDINGRANMLARYMPPGPTSSTLRDGQVFDNGTNVVIGGFLPFPDPTIPSFAAADVLTVKGRARVDGNTHVAGNMGIGIAPTANRLEVFGNSRLDGNAQVTGNLDVDTDANVDGNIQVDGDGRLDGRLIVGDPGAFALGSHKLYVNGSALAEEVVVKLFLNWPDYVLAENYDLKPLSDVEAFIQKEKHLPGVPSATEVSENGLNLGAMQTAQMEKIEELYLHVIEMNKQVQTLKSENEALKSRVAELEK